MKTEIESEISSIYEHPMIAEEVGGHELRKRYRVWGRRIPGFYNWPSDSENGEDERSRRDLKNKLKEIDGYLKKQVTGSKV